MISKVMLTMESRIHGDMYVRFGGGLAETYHRKVAKRCWPSPLKEIADLSGIVKTLGNRIAKRTFATTVTLLNGVPIESVSKMMGHTNIRTTQLYAKMLDEKVSNDMAPFTEIHSLLNELNKFQITTVIKVFKPFEGSYIRGSYQKS